MAPTLPRLTSGAALSSSSSSAGPKPDVITLSSSDDQQAASSRKRSAPASSKPDVITLSSSSSSEQEASSRKGSSSAGSKDGAVVLTSSDSDSNPPELLAKRRERRPPRNVAWIFSDEASILTALADERVESGRLPTSPSALLDAIRSRAGLKRENPTAGDVAKKVHNLKDKFKKAVASGGPSGGLRDTELYHLSVKVWPELLPRIVHNSSSSSSACSSNGSCSL